MLTPKTISGFITMAALATALASAPASADECKSVDINVRNGKTVKIKTLTVEYRFQFDNTWRTEQIPNVEVAPGALKLVAPNQNLAGGEGHKMLGMKLHFQAFCGGKWSKEFVTQEDNDFGNDAPCGKGRTYEVTVPNSNICEQIK
jgi:hypothetical protein